MNEAQHTSNPRSFETCYEYPSLCDTCVQLIFLRGRFCTPHPGSLFVDLCLRRSMQMAAYEATTIQETELRLLAQLTPVVTQ